MAGSRPEHGHRHALGVLLVHGIGEQKQGETLNEFGAPVIKWIDQWLSADTQVTPLAGRLARHADTKEVTGSASFADGALRPPALPVDTPAHATATVTTERAGSRPVAQSWLFAESWWSPQTLAPRVSPFLLWLITRGPWILLLHLGQTFRVDFRALSADLARGARLGLGHNLTLLRFGVATAMWLVVSLALILLWCVVSLLALVPIGYVRKRVYDALLALTGVIGDSYVLINDPIQRVAFANTTRQALAWLRSQGCRRVAVIAHSQGAAVSRDVLLTEGAPRADLFVTYGPGIAKVDAIADQERAGPSAFLWSGAAAPLALFAVLSFVRLSMGGQTGFARWGFPIFLAILSLIGIIIAWRSTAEALQRLPGITSWRLRQYQPGMTWKDFYASHDPVSNGPLTDTITRGLRRAVSRRVLVRASRFDDHTTYWTSTADFVPRVAQALAHCAGARVFATGRGARRLRAARALFSRSVWFLRVLRSADLVAVALPLWQVGRVRGAAADLRAVADGLPVQSVGGFLAAVEGALAWLGSLFAGRPVSARAVTDVVLLVVVVGAALHVWRRIVFYWWQVMAGHGLTPVFRPSDSTRARLAQGLLAVLVLALGVLPAVLSFAWTFLPGLITWNNLDVFLAGLATLVLVVAYAVIMVTMAWATREAVVQWRAAYRQHRVARQAARAVRDLWVVPAAWLFYGFGGGALLASNPLTPRVLPIAAALFLLGGIGYAVYRLRARS